MNPPQSLCRIHRLPAGKIVTIYDNSLEDRIAQRIEEKLEKLKSFNPLDLNPGFYTEIRRTSDTYSMFVYSIDEFRCVTMFHNASDLTAEEVGQINGGN